MNRTMHHKPTFAAGDGPKVVRRHARAAGFTLVELIVVVGIIVLLLGIVLAAVIRGLPTAERGATISWMNSIQIAITNYERDLGELPPEEGNNAVRRSQRLLEALVSPGNDDGKPGPGFRHRGRVFPAYIETAEAGVGRENGAPLFIDSWQNAIDYRINPDPNNWPEDIYDIGSTAVNAAPYLLHSVGPDGDGGTDDDIVELGK